MSRINDGKLSRSYILPHIFNIFAKIPLHPNYPRWRLWMENPFREDVEQEKDMIRQSNLERLEDENIREMRAEGLLRPTMVKPGENIPDDNARATESSSDDLADLPF